MVWFTGLSAAGKSTIAGLVAAELEQRGLVVDTLDGDVVRTHLSKGLGFSKEDRDTNIERIGWVASRLARAGAAVVVSAISPYDEARRRSRALVERYGLRLIRPEVLSVSGQHRREGPNLWERDPDRCCHIRKVEPLERALAPYSAWISGIRREQSPTRAGTPKVQWSERYGVWKIHPLADWDEKRIWAYIKVNEIPYNPLHEAGYRSIGCIPCTRPTTPEEEERAGRWAGSDKLECGIHGMARLSEE